MRLRLSLIDRDCLCLPSVKSHILTQNAAGNNQISWQCFTRVKNPLLKSQSWTDGTLFQWNFSNTCFLSRKKKLEANNLDEILIILRTGSEDCYSICPNCLMHSFLFCSRQKQSPGAAWDQHFLVSSFRVRVWRPGEVISDHSQELNFIFYHVS